MAKRTTTKLAAPDGESDPRQTLIVAAEDGTFWRVTEEVWRQEDNQITASGGLGVLQQLTNFGTYLAYIPPDLSVGIGGICTVVNLKAVLKNNTEVHGDAGKAAAE
ncbi:MAG TPA: hypothetical protein VJU61_15715 [Polyangiaceae bacterium]|nr:hypothetical protein [Polyangiaceae bacterium]